MKLNEIKNIEAIKAGSLTTIKGGGRDTRNDTPGGLSTYTDVTATPPKTTKKS